MAKEPRARFPAPAADFNNPHHTSLTIRKSRFETYGCRCRSGKEARAFVEIIRRHNPDADHNCWAYVAGLPGSTIDIGSSDDGEPSGTAGKPILDALLFSDTGQICMVVSRWFGGIKLGTGGLSRAYRECALLNLESMPKIENIIWIRWNLRLPYSLYERGAKFLSEIDVKILNSNFGDSVNMELAVPEDRLDLFQRIVGSLGNGKLRPVRLDPAQKEHKESGNV
ncbi:MAG: YigZ family protein [Desulfovibrio sp.]|nr:YigZ family protein [Desulfovibrio sp.]